MKKTETTKGILGAVASLALNVGVKSMSQTCFLSFNQPVAPKGMEKFKK